MGGDLTDGMDDINTPPPPMGVDNMDGDDEGPDPMGQDPMMDGPMGGQESPMGDEPPTMDDDTMSGEVPNGGGDDEFMNKFNSLPKDKQVAVEKYADSMLDDQSPMMDNNPMESRKNLKSVIDEVINDVLNDKEGTKRPNKDLPKEYRVFDNPFKSPF